MTRVEFHTHVPDKLAYSCRLLRKAYLSGARVAVVAEPDVLVALDQLLWRFSPVEFVPHCRAGAPEASVSASPIVLSKSLAAPACAGRGIVLNLGQSVPAGFEAFERLIEVVALDEGEAMAGRSRWRHYVAMGHSLKKHDRSQPKGPA
ncbi:MAG: DNA polymerase III subunit chi [Pseudomonadota bacterium]|nr:DNA polymerase III subunit chi [Pseudomonadota bacterium]